MYKNKIHNKVNQLFTIHTQYNSMYTKVWGEVNDSISEISENFKASGIDYTFYDQKTNFETYKILT